MPRKLSEMRDGELDQLTVRLPKSRLRYAAWAAPDIGTWLTMLYMRYERQRAALADARRHGANTAGGERYCEVACAAIAEMVVRLTEAWCLRDWHEAQTVWVQSATTGAPLPLCPDQTTTPAAGSDGGD